MFKFSKDFELAPRQPTCQHKESHFGLLNVVALVGKLSVVLAIVVFQKHSVAIRSVVVAVDANSQGFLFAVRRNPNEHSAESRLIQMQNTVFGLPQHPAMLLSLSNILRGGFVHELNTVGSAVVGLVKVRSVVGVNIPVETCRASDVISHKNSSFRMFPPYLNGICFLYGYTDKPVRFL